MPTGKDDEKSRTVILAADLCNCAPSVIALAAEIAAAVNSRLQGFFVEDEDLLTLSRSPLTREVSLTTAAARPASSERLQRLLRASARQFESTLQREAQALKVAWSYEYVRGRIRDVGLGAGVNVEFTILGGTGQRRVEPGPSRVTRRLLVVTDRSSRWARVLAVVVRRFAGERKQVLLVGDDIGALALPGADEANAASGPEIEFIRIDRRLMPDLLQRSGAAIDYAILPMREDPEELVAILEALRCPVILVA